MPQMAVTRKISRTPSGLKLLTSVPDLTGEGAPDQLRHSKLLPPGCKSCVQHQQARGGERSVPLCEGNSYTSNLEANRSNIVLELLKNCQPALLNPLLSISDLRKHRLLQASLKYNEDAARQRDLVNIIMPHLGYHKDR